MLFILSYKQQIDVKLKCKPFTNKYVNPNYYKKEKYYEICTMQQFNFTPFPNLESERLNFRRLTNNDVEAVFELRSSPETMKFIPRPLAKTLDDAYEHIKKINDNIIANSDINWAVTEKGNNKCIGVMGFYRTQPENYRTELGYMINQEHWGKGYVSEAVKTLLDFAFNTLKFHSVEAVIDSRHIASEKVLIKNGFRKEAHFVEDFFYNNEFCDTVKYGLLKREFNAKKIS